MKHHFYTLALLLLMWPMAASSHPHTWIDLDVTIEADESGLVKGLRVGWLFDEIYSAFALDNQLPSAEIEKGLAEDVLHNLKFYDYYTHIRVNGDPVKINTVSDYTSTFEKGRWRLEFTVPLEKKIDPVKDKLSYQIYDPSYYIAITHTKAGDAVNVQALAKCAYKVHEPSPPKNVSLMAAALDRTQNPGKPIGNHFTETVTVSCD